MPRRAIARRLSKRSAAASVNRRSLALRKPPNYPGVAETALDSQPRQRQHDPGKEQDKGGDQRTPETSRRTQRPASRSRQTSNKPKARRAPTDGQPFTAPEERPPMMCRCMIAKISRIGVTASSRVGKTIS
jgi:hypothetical protein